MKKGVLFLIFLILSIFFINTAGYAAPLFPDVPSAHWASDAVRELANKGILEGYPDGTFKGDRAATRWELALTVARLLSKMEAEHSKFATKEDLEQIKKLANILKEELDALGVRVINLEDNLQKLDKRVWGLEKITFYGDFNTRVVSQGFKNTGASQYVLRGVPFINYEAAVGFAAGANVAPPYDYGLGSIGVYTLPMNTKVSVSDYIKGAPLTNGVGATSKITLGTNIRVSDDVSAGVEFVGFNSTGDVIVDAFWGVPAPFLSNVFCGTMTNNVGGVQADQSKTNVPWTRVNLDNFWFIHNPSGMKLVVGAYNETKMDDSIYIGMHNPNFGSDSRVLPNYGFRFNGNSKMLGNMNYEFMYFMPPDSTVGIFAAPAPNTEYNNGGVAGTLEWLFEKGNFKINLLTVNNSFWAGNALNAGSLFYNNFFWVNPSEYQGVNVGPANAPIVWSRVPGGNDTTFGPIGPQSMTNMGFSFNYQLADTWTLQGKYASSNYKPNMASGYSVNGSFYNFSIGKSLSNNQLYLQLGYQSTDPTYDPMIFSSNFGNLTNIVYGYVHPTFPSYLEQLHNGDLYPNNRRGLNFKGIYTFKDEIGHLYFNYSSLDQVESSINNVSYISQAQNVRVFGFKPGWIEPFFAPLGVDANGVALEDIKGKLTAFVIGGDYTFNSKLTLNLNYSLYRNQRLSGLGNRMPANTFPVWSNFANNYNTNHIDFIYNIISLQLNYPLSDKFRLNVGIDSARLYGAYCGPQINLDTTQNRPFVGFNYQLSENTAWDLTLSTYNVTDAVNVDPNDALDNQQTWGNLNWAGYQLTTGVSVNF